MCIRDSINAEYMGTVLTDRSQGGGVIQPGNIEIMIHRRLLADDARGCKEPLNEKDYDGKGLRERVRHFIVPDETTETPKIFRVEQFWLDQTLDMNFLSSQKTEVEPREVSLGDALKLTELPDLVKLYVTLEEEGSFLVRFHNMDDLNTKSFPPPDFFKAFQSVQETSLSANQLKSEMLARKLSWNQAISNQTVSNAGFTVLRNESSSIDNVTLRPLEIRTFRLSNPSKRST
eukprot:TRINITY_DN10438_c0_g1_i2.p1 TRINITY_DN10438_c0_g1~~TRINITY_DN10438_c0_g1_i2.p1  ORF type:complete len:232 (+),score=66.82 TRINITY_DN10438_c0_g1_i2:60-755(+)